MHFGPLNNSARKRVTLADLFTNDLMIDARCVTCGYSAPIRPEWFWIRNRNFPKDTPVGEAMKCIRCSPCRPKRSPIQWKIVPRATPVYADRTKRGAEESHQIDWWRE
jgi:hypothetical protein